MKLDAETDGPYLMEVPMSSIPQTHLEGRRRKYFSCEHQGMIWVDEEAE